MHDYHNLLVWKKAVELVKAVYYITKKFPSSELYGMTSQLRRSAVSVVANIVEGRGKGTDKDFVRFLYITKGSLNECQCYFELTSELGFLAQEDFVKVESLRNEVGFLLFKLIKSIER